MASFDTCTSRRNDVEHSAGRGGHGFVGVQNGCQPGSDDRDGRERVRISSTAPSPLFNLRSILNSSGVGVGLCERLLEIYSLPAGHVIKEALPQPTALLSSIAASTSSAGARQTVLAGPALTLILAVRNTQAGEETKRQLLERLRRVIVQRSRKEGIGSNQSARWMDTLRIEVERVDFETPYGQHGILAFTERIRRK